MSSYTILTDQETKERKLIKLPPGIDPSPDLYERTSVNLSIGAFLPASSPPRDHVRLSPQEMILVISNEIVALPNDVTGYLVGKRSLASQGIMAINTGMIDPTFVGPLSVILVNFSDRPQDLNLGDIFLKAVFHGHPAVTGPIYSPPYDSALHSQIVREFTERRTREARSIAKTFLNLEGHAQTIANAVGSRIVRSAVVQATLAGVLLAILAIFLPIGAQMTQSFLAGSERQEIRELRGEIDNLRAEMAAASRPGGDRSNQN